MKINVRDKTRDSWEIPVWLYCKMSFGLILKRTKNPGLLAYQAAYKMLHTCMHACMKNKICLSKCTGFWHLNCVIWPEIFNPSASKDNYE